MTPYGISQADANGLILQTMTAREDLIVGLGSAFVSKEGSISKKVEKWLENINLEASPFAATESISALKDLDLRPQLSKIKILTAIYQGHSRQIMSSRICFSLIKELKGSYLVKFENSGHALFFEEAEKFNTELEKFARKS